MRVRGIEGMTVEEVHQEVAKGGKFVVYQWCVSLVLVTIMQPTSVRLVPGGKSTFIPGLPWSLLTLVAGWWGFPWGPIRTISALATNFGGGRDVTREVLASIRVPPPPSMPPSPSAPSAGPQPGFSAEAPPQAAEPSPATVAGAVTLHVKDHRSGATSALTLLPERRDLTGWADDVRGWSIGSTGSGAPIEIDEPGLVGAAVGIFEADGSLLLYGRLGAGTSWPPLVRNGDGGSAVIMPTAEGGISEWIGQGPLDIGSFRLEPRGA